MTIADWLFVIAAASTALPMLALLLAAFKSTFAAPPPEAADPWCAAEPCRCRPECAKAPADDELPLAAGAYLCR